MRILALLSILAFSLAVNAILPPSCFPYKKLNKFRVHLATKWKNPEILVEKKKTGTNEANYDAAKKEVNKYAKEVLEKEKANNQNNKKVDEQRVFSAALSQHAKTHQIRKDLETIVTLWAKGEVNQKVKNANVGELFTSLVWHRLFSNINDEFKILRQPFNYENYCKLLNEIEQECETLVQIITEISPLQKFFDGWQDVQCGSAAGSWKCKIKVDPDILTDDRLKNQLKDIIAILTRNPIPVAKTAGKGINIIKLAHQDQKKTVGPWMIKIGGTSDRLAAELDRPNHLKKEKQDKAVLKDDDFVDKPTNFNFNHIIAEH